MSNTSFKHKLLAGFLGLLCHITFIVAIALMAYMLFWGMTRAIFPLGSPALLVNFCLVLSFPVLHSLLLTRGGRRFIASLLPAAIGGKMVTTVYSLIASIQLIVIFVFWTPMGTAWFVPSGSLLIAWSLIYALSWALLARSIWEAGMGLQMGWIGWLAVVRERPVVYPPACFSGLHGKCRQPIYESFALILLTAPVWSLDRLIITLFWVAYCLVGPLFKEQRFKKIYGAQFEQYQQRVPYYLTPINLVLRFLRGADSSATK